MTAPHQQIILSHSSVGVSVSPSQEKLTAESTRGCGFLAHRPAGCSQGGTAGAPSAARKCNKRIGTRVCGQVGFTNSLLRKLVPCQAGTEHALGNRRQLDPVGSRSARQPLHVSPARHTREVVLSMCIPAETWKPQGLLGKCSRSGFGARVAEN